MEIKQLGICFMVRLFFQEETQNCLYFKAGIRPVRHTHSSLDLDLVRCSFRPQTSILLVVMSGFLRNIWGISLQQNACFVKKEKISKIFFVEKHGASHTPSVICP